MSNKRQTVCLPCGVKRQKLSGPCFTRDELICYLQAVASLYDVPLNEEMTFKQSREALWVAICTMMQKHHSTEPAGWLTDKNVRSHIIKTCPLLSQTLLLQALLPVFRGDVSTKWLPASNLVEVIHQRAPPTLHFEGVIAADLRFATKSKSSSPIDVNTIREHINNRGKKYWGMIMNVAIRSQPGEHWIALFSDKPNELEMYDSLGTPIHVTRRYGKSIRAIADVSAGWTLREVRTMHQTDDFMCGMYACYYILARAAGLPFETFQKQIVTHEDIKAFRAASIHDAA